MVVSDDDLARDAVAVLHYRGTPLEFEIARELASARDPVLQTAAGAILSGRG
jgi:hypothetical protein